MALPFEAPAGEAQSVAADLVALRRLVGSEAVAEAWTNRPVEYDVAQVRTPWSLFCLSPSTCTLTAAIPFPLAPLSISNAP